MLYFPRLICWKCQTRSTYPCTRGPVQVDKVMTSKSSHATSKSLHMQLQLLILAFCRVCNDFLICTTRNTLAPLRKEAHMLDCQYTRFRSLESNMANCSTEWEGLESLNACIYVFILIQFCFYSSCPWEINAEKHMVSRRGEMLAIFCWWIDLEAQKHNEIWRSWIRCSVVVSLIAEYR